VSYQISDIQGVGDIILVTQSHQFHGLGSAFDEIIKWATVSPFEHTAFVITDAHGHLVLAEALLHVTLSPLDKYAETGYLFHTQLDVTQQQRLSDAARSKVGQFYGWEMLIEDAVRDLAHIDWAPPLNPRVLDCSAFCEWAFEQAGQRLTWAPAPAPSDLSFSPILLGRRPWDRSSS